MLLHQSLSLWQCRQDEASTARSPGGWYSHSLQWHWLCYLLPLLHVGCQLKLGGSLWEHRAQHHQQPPLHHSAAASCNPKQDALMLLDGLLHPSLCTSFLRTRRRWLRCRTTAKHCHSSRLTLQGDATTSARGSAVLTRSVTKPVSQYACPRSAGLRARGAPRAVRQGVQLHTVPSSALTRTARTVAAANAGLSATHPSAPRSVRNTARAFVTSRDVPGGARPARAHNPSAS
mmetsp:Transcript_48638/g.112706  ORF Transcript_48638/g.112706 Transcript_48638/m.112706 type:complete len:232 (+) Transcript_48638:46-741(+)